MTHIIGREIELEKLEKIFDSCDAEFVAIYGRRRVGKTYLIREFFSNKKNSLFIECVGKNGGSLSEQIENFMTGIADAIYNGAPLSQPKNWQETFRWFTQEVTKLPQNKKIILFLDELPWLATRKSELLKNIEYFWNAHWSKLPNFKLIVCGSAASWILDNIIYAKGGLYNRVTLSILLRPFNLNETKRFLENAKCKFSNKQTLDLYLIMGGIPYYLKQIKRSGSVTQNIQSICFNRDGLLYGEFERLFQSLFDEHEIYYKIVRELASHRYGLPIELLAKRVGVSSGGRFRGRLDELESSGFVQRFVPYGYTKREQSYRLIDEYSFFYLRWIEKFKQQNLQQDESNYWFSVSKDPSWKSWAGYAFETICFKHISEIKKALGLSAIMSVVSNWRDVSKKGEKREGTQIDLLFDREDGVVTLCEIKYSDKLFVIDKVYARQLVHKITQFESVQNKEKQILLAMITTKGVKKNMYSEDLIDAEIALEDLFK